MKAKKTHTKRPLSNKLYISSIMVMFVSVIVLIASFFFMPLAVGSLLIAIASFILAYFAAKKANEELSVRLIFIFDSIIIFLSVILCFCTVLNALMQS